MKKRGPRNESERKENRVGYRKRRVRAAGEGIESSKSSMFSLVLIGICAVVFCVSAFQLFSIYSEYKAGKDSYKEVAELGITVPEAVYDENGDEVEVSYEYYYVDFDALNAVNSEVIGWIRFDSPEIISYPIMQASDNDKYLTTTFEGTANSAGAIFADTKNSSDFSDDNTIIYGHNMKNDSMFGALNEYNDGAFYNEYPYFYIYTPDGKASKYQVVAAEVIDAVGTDRYTINFGSASSYQTYIYDMLKTSYYDTGTEITTSSKLVTLSTCTDSSTTRFILQAVKIEEKDMVEPESE